MKVVRRRQDLDGDWDVVPLRCWLTTGVIALALVVVSACSGDDAASQPTAVPTAELPADVSDAPSTAPAHAPRDAAPAPTAEPPSSGSDASDAASDLTTTLAELLVTAEDVDFLFGNGEPPLAVGDEYYEERPTGLCNGGLEADMLADSHVFNLLDYDAFIFFGQWVSGERVSEATKRFAQGRQVLASCHELGYTNSDGDDIAFEQLEVENPGLDEVDGLVVTKNADPYLSVVYARHGGVITFMYFEGSFSDWTPQQLKTITDIGFTRLLAAGRLDLPAP